MNARPKRPSADITRKTILLAAKEIFLENGGDYFTLIPCLNERLDWVDSMVDLIGDESKHLVV